MFERVLNTTLALKLLLFYSIGIFFIEKQILFILFPEAYQNLIIWF